MSATNKTPFLELPSFVGSDIPGWLTSWNDAMSKIDTGVQGINTIAGTANNNANSAIQQVTVINDEIADIQKNMNEINTDISNIQNNGFTYSIWTNVTPTAVNSAISSYDNREMVFMRVTAAIAQNSTGIPWYTGNAYYYVIAQLNRNIFNRTPSATPTLESTQFLGGIYLFSWDTASSRMTVTKSNMYTWYNGQVTNFGVALTINNTDRYYNANSFTICNKTTPDPVAARKETYDQNMSNEEYMLSQGISLI